VGRGAGDEDRDHQRKYTIEPDPEELFGTDEVTAPPVIGEEDDEEEVVTPARTTRRRPYSG
jgi:hypothetical protein